MSDFQGAVHSDSLTVDLGSENDLLGQLREVRDYEGNVVDKAPVVIKRRGLTEEEKTKAEELDKGFLKRFREVSQEYLTNTTMNQIDRRRSHQMVLSDRDQGTPSEYSVIDMEQSINEYYSRLISLSESYIGTVIEKYFSDMTDQKDEVFSEIRSSLPKNYDISREVFGVLESSSDISEAANGYTILDVMDATSAVRDIVEKRYQSTLSQIVKRGFIHRKNTFATAGYLFGDRALKKVQEFGRPDQDSEIISDDTQELYRISNDERIINPIAMCCTSDTESNDRELIALVYPKVEGVVFDKLPEEVKRSQGREIFRQMTKIILDLQEVNVMIGDTKWDQFLIEVTDDGPIVRLVDFESLYLFGDDKKFAEHEDDNEYEYIPFMASDTSPHKVDKNTKATLEQFIADGDTDRVKLYVMIQDLRRLLNPAKLAQAGIISAPMARRTQKFGDEFTSRVLDKDKDSTEALMQEYMNDIIELKKELGLD